MERIPVRFATAATLAAVLVVAILSNGPSVRAAGVPDQLPDLVADAPAHPTLDYYAYPDGSHDLLLRFDGYIHNAGMGALDIRGSRSDPSQPMPPVQRVYRTDGSHHDDPMPANAQLFYTNADGHHHWHLQNVARYSLWSGDRRGLVAPALKVGFCLDDSEHIETDRGPTQPVYSDANGRRFCQRNSPDAISLFEGVSAGWRDLYARTLSLQWVVVSDVQPGKYWLREDVDPTRVIHESHETNAPAFSAQKFAIPGYEARAVFAPRTPTGKSQKVTLGADAYGSPGPRRFKIVSLPAHGKLDVQKGKGFASASVTYKPAAGYRGLDRFTYEAVDSTSPYPRHPGTATVAVAVGVPPSARVAIYRAPLSVTVGTGVRLHARVSHDSGGVTWSVNGIAGGNAKYGRITARGFYRAPETAPAARVRIAATSRSGAQDHRLVKIAWVAPPGASPGTSRQAPGSIRTSLDGRLLAASVTPQRAGVVSMTARVRGRRLGSCAAKTPRDRRFTCRLYVPDGLELRHLEVVATLVRGHRVIARVHRSGRP